jgi:hypothetical protein
VLEFSGDRPSFCAYCGQALAETCSEPVSPSEAVTLPPAAAAPAGPAEPAPEVVGGYRLLRRLGGGGMGEVYEAEDIASGRRVALKLISPGYVRSPDAVARFRQEGRLASALNHPRCVFVLATDEVDGRPYIVMELMPGPTLQDLINSDGPLPPEQAVAKILDVIDGLHEAHRLGVIHRDVKPSNCFLEADGRVKIGDFGLSKSLTSDAQLTRTGTYLGTPLYSSPEQVRGEPVDPQSDVYSVAATLYCLLAGKAPFQGSDPAATLARIVCDDPPPLRDLRPEVPAALERVVLRGLERDRGRRWRDLEEFRRALLPFVPGRLSIAGLGMRFGAYLIDVLAIHLVMFVVTWLLIGAKAMEEAQAPLTEPIELLLVVLYFGVPEGLWGWSVGKRLLGLRVWSRAGFEPPGVWRAALRIATLYTLLHLGIWAALALILWYGPREWSDYAILFRDHFLVWLLISTLPMGWYCPAILLTVSTMRARNGYRGLHEFLSGTRTVALPQPSRRRTARPRPLEPGAAPGGLPERLGPFVVRGCLCRAGESSVLLGESPAPGRQVLLWLRPAAAPPLPEARHDLARTTRLRWLGAGRLGEQQWDAFLAPAGCPLADWVADTGRLTWADVRPLLAELTAELIAATGDETLPTTLSAGQVWIDAGGRVQLLDPPLAEQSADPGSPERRALALLAEAASLALEGRPRGPKSRARPVAAPVPLYARPLLAQLFDADKPYKSLAAWQKALAAVEDRPAEVTRARRLAHVALLAVFLFPGLCFFLWPGMKACFETVVASFVVADGEAALRALDEGAARDLAGGVLNPDPGTRLAALVQYDADLHARGWLELRLRSVREQHQARHATLSPLGRGYAGLVEGQLIQAAKPGDAGGPRSGSQDDFRRWAESAGHIAPPGDPEDAVGLTFAVVLPIVFWVPWAFLWRGGLSDRLLGLALVRRDGRPAARWQCAWRALLVWLPVTALVAGSIWLDLAYWNGWIAGRPAAWLAWLSLGSCWLAFALLVAYAILALRWPERGPHDRLAGTRVVPR